MKNIYKNFIVCARFWLSRILINPLYFIQIYILLFKFFKLIETIYYRTSILLLEMMIIVILVFNQYKI